MWTNTCKLRANITVKSSDGTFSFGFYIIDQKPPTQQIVHSVLNPGLRAKPKWKVGLQISKSSQVAYFYTWCKVLQLSKQTLNDLNTERSLASVFQSFPTLTAKSRQDSRVLRSAHQLIREVWFPSFSPRQSVVTMCTTDCRYTLPRLRETHKLFLLSKWKINCVLLPGSSPRSKKGWNC